MKIEILGMGCPKCRKLYENAKKAVEKKGVQAEVLKIDDINKITEYGILSTPAIAIDGKIKASGRIPEPGEIEKWIE
ncbi:MAG: TM0996/MTH895 family glutaredoxin-like protein [Candidatus Omnitrophica bacterium]|nr:TM0996/MTH895 family glutaredoxin-like protein [Candidatus Omnitrophota bacterium]MBU1932412.1 TM0996/MTH895 family glutaredoxin-like protein [Candidatus Omnitrophota bacterium]